MNHLFAKVNDRAEKYRKLLSDSEIYAKPENLEKSVEYNPSYKLEEDEWYIINDFSMNEFCIEILKIDMDSTNYKMVNKVEPEKIEYILSYQNGDLFYFQRVFKSNLLKRKRFINIGDEIQVREARHGLILNEIPDALYIKSEDRLYFKKIEKISPIFRGVEKLYREATQREIDEFLKNHFIKIGSEYNSTKVGKANRHRIALAMDTLDTFNNSQKQEVFEYTSNYFPSLKYSEDAFEINNEEELKNLLFGIEQRYYTTPITQEKRVANSISAI